MSTKKREAEQGAVLAEFVLFVAVTMMGLMLIVLAWRQNGAHMEAVDVAQAAARSATLGRDEEEATSRAAAVLDALPDTGAAECSSSQTVVDVSRFQEGWVTVTVTCQVDYTGLTLITNAIGTSVTESWVEVVDPARRTLGLAAEG